MTDISDRSTPSRLEEMHDLGLLSALMPEWEPSTGRVQHDIYHVYTVDQHALYAISRMHAIARGDLADEFPVLTETIRAIEHPVALFMGTLLHDVGKPWGKPHSDIGADLMVTIGRRLGMDEEDVHRAEFLVRQHLVMGQMSQRRDLEDYEMIADFARACEDEENLRELYLLTFCDLSSVAPDNLTSWKETLLRELFQRARTALRRGGDLLGAERKETVKRRQGRAERLLIEESPGQRVPEDSVPRVPRPLFRRERVGPHRLAHEADVDPARVGAASIIRVTQQKRIDATEMVLAAVDVPGLLAEVAGVLHANRIDVLDAAIYSRDATPRCPPRPSTSSWYAMATAGRSPTRAMAQDRRRPGGGALGPHQGRDLGGHAVEPRVAGGLARPRGSDRNQDRQPGQPRLHGGGGDLRDRPGVLYSIARTLFAEGLDIHRSKIASEANRVVDTFYLRDKATGRRSPTKRGWCGARPSSWVCCRQM